MIPNFTGVKKNKKTFFFGFGMNWVSDSHLEAQTESLFSLVLTLRGGREMKRQETQEGGEKKNKFLFLEERE